MKNISPVKHKNSSGKTNTLSILIVVLYLTFLPNLYGQSRFTPGYIITMQNDTIKGSVKYKDWIESPNAIDFKDAVTPTKTFSTATIKEFGIYSDRSIYRSKHIGLLDITHISPSLIATDSIQVFLKALVLGKYASLYLYLDDLERTHYFLERNGNIVELLNYSWNRTIGSKTHRLQIDNYKEQLRELAEASPRSTDSLPLYQEKHMKRYIINFNSYYPDHGDIYQSEREKHTFDLDFNIGIDSWNELPVVLKRKLTFGIGARVNFPGNFHNRFLKINIFLTPDILVGYDQSSYRRIELRTYEIAIGSYIGRSRLRPYIGVHHSGVGHDYRLDFLGLQAGISLDRRINLEIGHFLNFASAITETTFLTQPRISLHYMVNLNFKRKS